MISQKTLTPIFIFCGGCVALTMLYHAYGIVDPQLRPGYPWQRHLFWVFAGFIGLLAIARRRWYFLILLGAVVVQQYWGHGSQLIDTWQAERRISLIDLFAVLNISLLFIAYIWDLYLTRRVSKNNSSIT